jgi:nitrate reductase gamma subunit
MQMKSAELLVGVVMPYLAVTTFLGGAAYRLISWSKLPQPGKMTLYPTRGWGLGAATREALFFPSLYRSDKWLWLLAWSFHVALALALVGHLRVFTGMIDSLLVAMGLSRSGLGILSAFAGGAAGLVLVVAASALLLRRLLLPRAREISSSPDFLALLLLIAVITTGDLMRFGSTAIDLAETRAWAASLLTLSPTAPTNPAFLLHAFCAEVLLIYLPLSKVMHFGGLFYTVALVRRS